MEILYIHAGIQLIEAIKVSAAAGTRKPIIHSDVEYRIWSTSGQLLALMDINDDPYWQFFVKAAYKHDEHKEATP